MKVDTYGYHRLYSDFWSYDLKVAHLRDINTTIIAHLQTSYMELHGILTIIAREHVKVKLSNNEVAIVFIQDSRHYEITTKNTTTHPQNSLITLVSGVYAIKKSRFSHLSDK